MLLRPVQSDVNI